MQIDETKKSGKKLKQLLFGKVVHKHAHPVTGSLL